MAASYPAGFDTMSDPSANLSGPPLHSTMHNQINDVLEAIEAELGINPSGTAATVAAVTAVTAWTAPTLLNSWVNYGAPFGNCQYRRVGDIVYLRGLVKSGTIATTVFVLPVGFRPVAQVHLPAASNGAFGDCQIAADGSVSAFAGSNLWFSFDGVQFSTTS